MKKTRTPRMPPYTKLRTPAQIARSPRRTPLYDKEAHCVRAKRLAMLGLTNFEIADYFGISESTLNKWAQVHPEFGKALRSGKIEADAKVAEAVYKRAIGYDNPNAVKIFQGTETTGPIKVPYTEHYPPDVQAQRMWLNNRQSNRWRDRQEVEHSGSIEMRLRAMTPEQRRTRLLELHARVVRIAELEAQNAPEDPDGE